MKKNILLLSIMIAMLGSCKDNESIDSATQYVGYWNYTTKGTVKVTATNLDMSIPIDLTGTAKIRQDSVYVTNSKIPNQLIVNTDIFHGGSVCNLTFSGTNLSGISLGEVYVSGTKLLYNCNYTGIKSGNTITINATFSNYNNAHSDINLILSGSEKITLTKVN
jgi:uncharacterized protein YjbI with pentapeptide repeats